MDEWSAAERELVALCVSAGLSEKAAEDLVVELSVERQGLLSDLVERPQRCWRMADAERGPLVFFASDEFDNRTVATWLGRRFGYLVLLLAFRLKTRML